MSWHIHNVEAGQSIWGPPGINPYAPDCDDAADWQWWLVESIEPVDVYTYRLHLVGEDGKRDVVLLNEALSVAAKDNQGEPL